MTVRKTFLTFSALLLLAGGFFATWVIASGDTTMNQTENMEKATLAGGCFWCVEADMKRLDGVIDVVSGYAGGTEEAPSYEEVASGRTGHREAVQVTFDPAKISYAEVLAQFWRHFDPTDEGGSFADRGFQYTSAIFYHDTTQRDVAEASRTALEESGRLNGPVVTPILPFSTFYPAEEYHQDYSEKSTARYKSYRFFSGRDRYVEKTWGNRSCPLPTSRPAQPAAARNATEVRGKLTPLQYQVTQESGTEPPFNNEFWDNKREGIYVDIVSGEPLFSSTDKFDSGSGWPSFTQPLKAENIVKHKDDKLFMSRTEVRSRNGNSHLGHVFDDGPPPTGTRYCINSASLRFIPRNDLEKEGYGEYEKLFE